MTEAKIIDGKAFAKRIRERVAKEVSILKENYDLVPSLTVVLVGDDPASKVYVTSKGKQSSEAGMGSNTIHLDENVSEQDLLDLIKKLNNDTSVNGILVQLPLPKHLNATEVLDAIDPSKDVDGFHPVNAGLLSQGRAQFVPCTPLGVMRLLEDAQIETSGKHAVIVGRSDIVGKPMAQLLLQANSTVSICHSRTRDLAQEVGRADIVVAAVGRPEMVQGEWIKEGAVVVDVGINRLDDGRLVGDVDFVSAAERASYITPVPGGVGPMTIAMLMENTLRSAANRQGIDLDF